MRTGMSATLISNAMMKNQRSS